MKQISTTFHVNGRTYTFALGQHVPYLVRLGTRRAPPLSCEARVSFVSTDEDEPLIRLEFTHPHQHTAETLWLTGNQFWRAAPGPVEEWLQSHPQQGSGENAQGENSIDRELAMSVLRVGKHIAKRLDLLRGRNLIHLLADGEQAFLMRGYRLVRGYYLGPYEAADGITPTYEEQQRRAQAFEALRAEIGLSVHAFALLDAALLELHHEQSAFRVLAHKGGKGR